MTNIILQYTCIQKHSLCINLAGSKSISQRALIINKLGGFEDSIYNLSNSNDTTILFNALKSSNSTVDLFNSGTSLRFLVAFFAMQNKIITIKGHKYLFTRPIDLLLKYLNQLGANIERKNASIFIEKSNLIGGDLKLDLMKTSQFVTALLLISPYLKKGLKLHLPNHINSFSYVNMTLSMMQDCGINLKSSDRVISVPQSNYSKPYNFIESDWSSASYLYMAFLFSDLQKLQLNTFFQNSIQPDSSLMNFFKKIGVFTKFISGKMILIKKNDFTNPKLIKWDFNNNPDLFPAILITCLGLGIELFSTGLDTLPYKESDRIITMQRELLKFNAQLKINPSNTAYLPCCHLPKKNKIIPIETYNDHRIALAFSTLVFLGFKLEIKNYQVISKSYPQFFNDLVKFGVLIKK